MKKNNRYNLIILIILVISFSLAGMAFARVIETFTGNGTATIAKWNIVLKKDGTNVSNTFNFNLANTKNANPLVDPEVVAPGDAGSFTLNLSDTGTQVSYRYKIELDTSAFTEEAGNIKFYSDSSFTEEWVNEDDWTSILLPQAGSQSINKIIYWKWDAGEGNNANDTIAGIAAANLNFTVTVIAEQLIAPPVAEFEYTGNVQTYIVPMSGKYELEVWGAEGGNGGFGAGLAIGGKGGYSYGQISLTAGTTVYIIVGGKGGSAITNNGGGGGGGATDIRVNGTTAANVVIVAGGGGGGGQWSNMPKGGYGGGGNEPGGNGEVGVNATSFGYGAVGATGGKQGASSGKGGDFGKVGECGRASLVDRNGGGGGGATMGGGGGGNTSSGDASGENGGNAMSGTNSGGGGANGFGTPGNGFGTGGKGGGLSLAAFNGTGGGGGYGGGGGGGSVNGGGGGGGGYAGGGGAYAGGAGGGSGYIGGVTLGGGNHGGQTMPAPLGGTQIGQAGNGFVRIRFVI